MLFIGLMSDDEVVNVRNCRRYAEYTGYLHSFRCVGAMVGTPITDILVIDACTSEHFSKANVVRDVRKAYTSFAALKSLPAQSLDAAPQPVISSGRWGCGVFGGLPAHKFLQQVCGE